MKIVQIKESFDIDVGAPIPTILSNEHALYLIFYTSNANVNSDSTTVHIRNEEDNGIVTLKFSQFAQFKFGSPNDETINGHPLYKLGLEPYSIQKVEESEWIKELAEINSVHPYHQDSIFSHYEHLIFFFHDTCFEIVSNGYSIERKTEPNLKDEIQRIAKILY